MRICITGTCSQGKSTLIDDFLKEWPQYTTPENTYRKLLKNKWGIKTTKDLQWNILNCMVDELQRHHDGDKVVYDRGPLDNIASTLWAFSKEIKGVDDSFVQKCITIVRESLKHVDIIFHVPITKVVPFDHETDKFLKNKKKGLVDDEYRTEIDNILKAIKRDWDTNPESKFFDPHDKPAIIEVFGSPEERLQIMKYYIDVDGDAIDDTSAIMSAEEINQMEEVKAQLGLTDSQSQVFKNPKGYE